MVNTNSKSSLQEALDEFYKKADENQRQLRENMERLRKAPSRGGGGSWIALILFIIITIKFFNFLWMF